MTENGEAIDASAEIDGVAYTYASGLRGALKNNPSAVSCMVNRLFSYGVGREVLVDDRKWLKSVRKQFASGGHQFMTLLRHLATSDEFYQDSKPESDDVLAAK